MNLGAEMLHLPFESFGHWFAGVGTAQNTGKSIDDLLPF
jgi:hypothetical protein